MFPGIVGYDETVIPELNIALLAQHDLLFLGEKGQAKSRLMRRLVDFLDDAVPYLDDRKIPLHDDPYRPITARGKMLVNGTPAGRGADRLVAARGAVRGAVVARHEVRRHHRGN